MPSGCRIAELAGLWCGLVAGALPAGAQSPQAPAAPAPARSVWDSVYTVEQASAGAASYARQCASCHGADLSGGEMAPPLAGAGFLANWNGLSVGELYQRIRISMPLDAPGRLPRSELAALVAYLLQANGFPAGARELVAQPEALQQIRIEATRR